MYMRLHGFHIHRRQQDQVLQMRHEIFQTMTNPDLTNIDFPKAGMMIWERVLALVDKVNEFMTQLSMLEIQLGPNSPDWKKLKRGQRAYENFKKMEAAHEARKRKYAMEQLQKAISAESARYGPGRNAATSTGQINPNVIAAILGPFSSRAKRQANLLRDFKAPLAMPLSMILPFRAIIVSNVGSGTTLQDLPTYTNNPRIERIAQLQHALSMAQYGEIMIYQSEPGGPIQVMPPDGSGYSTLPLESKPNTVLTITTQKGETLTRDWSDFSDIQKNKIIADALQRRIMCKSV